MYINHTLWSRSSILYNIANSSIVIESISNHATAKCIDSILQERHDNNVYLLEERKVALTGFKRSNIGFYWPSPPSSRARCSRGGTRCRSRCRRRRTGARAAPAHQNSRIENTGLQSGKLTSALRHLRPLQPSMRRMFTRMETTMVAPIMVCCPRGMSSWNKYW